MHATSNVVSAAPKRRTVKSPPAPEFDFIPDALRSQCRNLILTFHAMHGYSCLPNMLWTAGLSGFIETHRNLNEALRKASTTRSARRANELFVAIATEILSLEVLAREYASWSAAAPAAKVIAAELLDANTPASRTWLMQHYLYPPRYNSPAATITLPPAASALGAITALDGLPEGQSFRDVVLACRAEKQARQSRQEPVLAMQGADR